MYYSENVLLGRHWRLRQLPACDGSRAAVNGAEFVSDVAVRLGYTFADRPNESFRQSFGLAAIVALAIYLSSQAGFLLRLPQSGIGFVWPPNAVLFVALLLVPESWVVVLAAALVGHVVAHTQDGLPVTIQALELLRQRDAGRPGGLAHSAPLGLPLVPGDLRTTGVFLGAAVAAPIVASLVPAMGYVWSGWAPDFSTAWRARVLSNVITMVILPPVLLLAPSALAELRREAPSAPSSSRRFSPACFWFTRSRSAGRRRQ